MKVALNNQRTEDFKKGEYVKAGEVIKEMTDDLPQFVKDYHDFYIEHLEYHPRSCCSFNTVFTEFKVQGLELDMPIVAWGPE